VSIVCFILALMIFLAGIGLISDLTSFIVWWSLPNLSGIGLF